MTEALTLTITLWGPLQVAVGGEAAEFRTDAMRALLVYLAAHQGIPQRRDTLAALLSPDRPDHAALTYLRNRLTLLRTSLRDADVAPPWLEVDRKQILLREGDDIHVDLAHFERLLAEVEGHNHRRLAGCPPCLARLQEAVGMVQGGLVEGLSFPSESWEAWLTAWREQYHQYALAAMTLLREARLALGEWEAALEVALRQLQLEPWLEAAHRAAMLAYYQLGERSAALAQFERCEQSLWEELGVEPEAESQQLRQRIVEGTLEAGGTAIPDNLPPQTGRFWGRDAEQRRLLTLLADPAYRLVTLVGTGGIGKTRLAIEVGQRIRAAFPDGVWLLAVDTISGGAEQIKMAVGEAAGLGPEGKQLTGDQVLALLRERQMLLILDNCEVALDALDFIPTWLARAPQVAILATSREPLALRAEVVLPLDGLPTGVGEMRAAEQMFVERGRMARADFALSASELTEVRHICTLVDGSPLGIALAAAWVRRRSIAQIVASIGQSLDFLHSRERDADPRHRSMRAVFESSWQMLNDEEQAVLAALSIFPTSFSTEAASRVAGAGLDHLDLLCEKSLLQQQHDAERYQMHSLVQQFASEKLAARAPAIRRALADYFHDFAREHQRDYAAFQPEWRNLMAAIAEAEALGEWRMVLDFATTMDEAWFRQMRYNDMREALRRAVVAATALEDHPALARLLLRLSELEMELNDYESANRTLQRALHDFMRLEDDLGIASATYLIGRIESEQGQDEAALARFETSRQLFEAQGDTLGVAQNLTLIAVYHFKQHRDFERAGRILQEALDLQRDAPASARQVETLRYLARVHIMEEAVEAAEGWLSEASEVSRDLDDRGEYGAVLFERVLLAKRRGEVATALALGYECLELFRQLGSLRWEGLIKTQLGLLHQAAGDAPAALMALEEGLAIFGELGDLYEQAYSYYYLSILHAEVGDTVRSHEAKASARRLNRTLNNPQLSERLR